MNILFVSNENVCRSPMAEALLKKKFENAGRNGFVDSAGFESYRINESPDARAVQIGETFGYSVEGKMRLFSKEDFEKFDRIFVMDMKNYMDVMALAKTKEQKKKVEYLLNLLEPDKNKPLANPMMNGKESCLRTFKILDKATDALIEKIKANRL